MEIFLLILRLVLSAIFLLAGIGKLLDLKGSEKAVKEFGVPESLAKPLGIILPLAEISLAISLLFVETSWFGAIGATILLLMFIGGMLWQMKQGNAPDCHCFGQIHSEPVSVKSLLRNVVFIVLALSLVIAGRANQGVSLFDSSNNLNDFMLIVFGLIFVGFSIVVLNYLKNISEQQNQILRRLEVLEIISNDGVPQTREDIGNPFEGLPIGSPLVDFKLPTVDGRTLTRREILADSKPILIFNVSPTCNPCDELLPKIETWEKELADKVKFLFISKGTPKENLAKFKSELNREIILQNDREFAELLEIRWTPTVLLVNKDGAIASHPAVGGEAIEKLLNEIKAENLDDAFLYVAQANGNGKQPKIGEAIPEFSLPDLNGEQISTQDFRGKKTLVTFWSMTCSFCLQMIEELSEWDKVKGKDEPNLIVFSDGDANAHKDLKLNAPIVLDKEYETAEKFGMDGTPSAVLVNEDGKIISETAIGAEKIWALLGRRKV